MHIELWENVSQCITSWQCRVGRRLIAFIFLILPCDVIQGVFCFDCDVVAFWQQDKNNNQIVWQQQCATTPQCAVASVCFSFLPVMPWGFGSLFLACNIVVGFLDHCFATLLSIFYTATSAIFCAWDTLLIFSGQPMFCRGKSTINVCIDLDKLFCVAMLHGNWLPQLIVYLLIFISQPVKDSGFQVVGFSWQTPWQGKIKSNNKPVHIASGQSATALQCEMLGWGPQGWLFLIFDFDLTRDGHMASLIFCLQHFVRGKQK